MPANRALPTPALDRLPEHALEQLPDVIAPPPPAPPPAGVEIHHAVLELGVTQFYDADSESFSSTSGDLSFLNVGNPLIISESDLNPTDSDALSISFSGVTIEQLALQVGTGEFLDPTTVSYGFTTATPTTDPLSLSSVFYHDDHDDYLVVGNIAFNPVTLNVTFDWFEVEGPTHLNETFNPPQDWYFEQDTLDFSGLAHIDAEFFAFGATATTAGVEFREVSNAAFDPFDGFVQADGSLGPFAFLATGGTLTYHMDSGVDMILSNYEFTPSIGAEFDWFVV
jgi:hypothetical protein